MQAIRSLAPGMLMVIVSVVFLSQTFAMEKATITDPAAGSFLPAILSVIMLITGLIVLWQERPRRKGSDEETAGTGFTRQQYIIILTFFVITVVYVILLPLITFFPATILYLVATMVFLRNVSWKVIIAVTLGSCVVIYLLFTQLFRIIFP